MSKSPVDTRKVSVEASPRRRAVMEAARKFGLLGGESSRIGGRIRLDLVTAAKTKSGIASDTELLEYALARVAVEDDFGSKLVRRKGRIARDVDLEF